MTNLDSILKSRDITLLTKVCLVKAMVFESSHVWMWELDYKESIDCFWTMALKKTLESPLDCKETKPVNPKGNQLWTFIGRTDAEVETPIFGHLMWRIDPLEKTQMLGKIEGRRRGQQRMRWLMESLTQWMWVWASSGSWRWTWKPGLLQSMGSQRVWRLGNWTTATTMESTHARHFIQHQAVLGK